MLIQNGHQQLQDFTNKNYKQTITEVTKGVWFVLGLGHSNAIFIEAGSSVILIDNAVAVALNIVIPGKAGI